MHDLHVGGLAAYALNRGGSLHPIFLPQEVLGNEGGIMNPSIYIDEGKILVNIRHVNYILFHSEANKFPHKWGHLVYVHPQSDVTLRTHNVIAELDQDMNVLNSGRVNMALDTKPTWNFIGLEDARLFKWDDKLYLCGVRRDCYDDKGKGRMELCHVEFNDEEKEWKEISRHPIPAPNGDGSYCEKNWMPVLDMPYHFVKWCNPFQLVKYDIETGECVDVVVKEKLKNVAFQHDFRGGSQVIDIGNGRKLAFVHETTLLKDPFNRKDGNYGHRAIVWDEDWNLIHTSKEFHFMGAWYDDVQKQERNIEFAVGASIHKGNMLISYGLSDNCSFILKIPLNVFFEFLNDG